MVYHTPLMLDGVVELVFQTIIIVQKKFMYLLIIVILAFILEMIKIRDIILLHLVENFSTVMDSIKPINNFINITA